MLQTEAATTGDDTPPDPPLTGRRWPADRIVAAAVTAGIFAVTVIGFIALIANLVEGERHSSSTPAPGHAPDHCDDVAILYGVHGTDCWPMPVVTAPGALGPANTGGPGGGTDWVPAFPGSNVWIAEQEISGRLFVYLPRPGVPPPEGYEQIGQTRSGAILYWRPHGHPDSKPTVEQGN